VMMTDDECGAVGGILGRGNWSAQRKPAPVPLCPPQIPHDLTWVWTWAAMMRSWQLATWSTARPDWQPDHCLWADCLDNVGSSTSHNLVGLRPSWSVAEIALLVTLLFHICIYNYLYCLCGLVVRVSGYRSRGPRFDSWHF
jgi:hypothetical protein